MPGDYRLVDQAAFWPQACICGTITPPLLDSGIERFGERIYLCQLCTKQIAEAMGFAEGEELDKLATARKDRTDAVRELEQRDHRVRDLEDRNAALEESLQQARAEAERQGQRADQALQLVEDIRASVGATVAAITPAIDPMEAPEPGNPADVTAARGGA